MRRSEGYSVVGVVPIATEKPCFCTPIFRDANASSLFAQTSSDGKIVDEFVDVHGAVERSLISVKSNRELRIGDELLSAFRSYDGSIIVDTRLAIYEGIVCNIKKYSGDVELLSFVIEKILREELLFNMVREVDSRGVALHELLNVIVMSDSLQGDIRVPNKFYVRLIEKSKKSSAIALNRKVIKRHWPNTSYNDMIKVFNKTVNLGGGRVTRELLSEVLVSLLLQNPER